MRASLKTIKSSNDLRQVLSELLLDVRDRRVELEPARTMIKAAAQINVSLGRDIEAARLGLEMARSPLAIGPVKM